MANKIIEVLVEPSKIEVNSTFWLKVKVEKIQSYDLMTENEENLVTETGENIRTEGDFYE